MSAMKKCSVNWFYFTMLQCACEFIQALPPECIPSFNVLVHVFWYVKSGWFLLIEKFASFFEICIVWLQSGKVENNLIGDYLKVWSYKVNNTCFGQGHAEPAKLNLNVLVQAFSDWVFLRPGRFTLTAASLSDLQSRTLSNSEFLSV